jgi:hypothetical protein
MTAGVRAETVIERQFPARRERGLHDMQRCSKAESTVLDELPGAPAFARGALTDVNLHQTIRVAVIPSTRPLVDAFAE